MAKQGKAGGRSVLAQKAQFRTSGGAMGGSKKLKVKRKRRLDRLEERAAGRDERLG